jgi:hypothetical protein
MRGWGGEIGDRHVRLVFRSEPVERLARLGPRLWHHAPAGVVGPPLSVSSIIVATNAALLTTAERHMRAM